METTNLPVVTNGKNVIWTSRDLAIATVDTNGIVNPLAAGTTIITATSNDGKYSATSTVNVVSALTGTASITGSVIFGETLTASLTVTNNTGTLLYQWTRGGTDIAGAISSTYILVQEDIGKVVAVKISSDVETGTITSNPTLVVEKANSVPVTGVVPILSNKSHNSVTLTTVAGYEYTVLADNANISGATWQDSNVVTSLTANTPYDFYQRVKETATHKASATSAKLDVTTEVAPPDALTGIANVTGSVIFGETLTASLTVTNNTGTLLYQWTRGGTDIAGATNQTYILVQEDIGKVVAVKISSDVETGIITSNPTSAVEKANSAPVTGVVPILSSKTHNSVTLTTVAGYEYTVLADNANISGATWQDRNVFTSLTADTPYDFYQRVKETATHKASATSAKLDVTTEVAPPALTGTPSITGNAVFGETLTASLDSNNNTGTLLYQWTRGGTDIAGAISSTYLLLQEDIGTQITVKISSDVETGTITSNSTSAVEKATSAPAIGIVPVLLSKTHNSVT